MAKAATAKKYRRKSTKLARRKKIAAASAIFLVGVFLVMSEGCEQNPSDVPVPATQTVDPITATATATATDSNPATTIISKAQDVRHTLGHSMDELVADIEKNGVPGTSELVMKGLDKAHTATEYGISRAGQAISSAQNRAGNVDARINEAVAEITSNVGIATATDENGNVVAKNYGPFDIEQCYVIRIADGDTATCLQDDKKTQVRIRFAQIDAPESKQDFGTVSRQALADLIFNKHVDLAVEEVDRYGRTVAEVYIDGVNVNKYMVQNGYAWAYKEYMRNPVYLDLQKQAERNKIGLWSHKNAIYPQDFRKQQAAARAAAKN